MYHQTMNHFNYGYPQNNGQQTSYRSNNNGQQIGFNGYNGQQVNDKRQFKSSNRPKPHDFPIVSFADEYVRQTWKNMTGVTNKVVLDTCSVMPYRAENVPTLFQQIIYPLKREGVQFFIMEETWLEICRLAVNAENEESRLLAAESRRYLEACVVSGIVEIIKGVAANPDMIRNGRFADASIVSFAFDHFSHGGKLSVITRDKKLAMDLKDMGRVHSVERNRGVVHVLYLDTKLKLKPYQVQEAAQETRPADNGFSRAPIPFNGIAGNRLVSDVSNSFRSDEPEQLASTETGQLTDLAANNLYELNGGMKAPTTNSVLQVMSNGSAVKVTLGERIGGGTEGGIYRLKEEEFRNCCAKILAVPSSRVKTKVDLMTHNMKPVDGVAMPRAMLFNNNVFCGYVMDLYNYAITLADVYDGKAGDQIDGFTRVDYVMAAQKLARIWSDLDGQGIRIVDFNPNNVLFIPQNGEYCGASLVVVDLDSAQVDTAKIGKNYGVIPAGGFCEGFIDYAVGKFTVDTIMSESNMVMGLAQAIFKLCCVGLHPYDVVPERGPDLSLGQASEMGLYLYSSRYPKIAGYSVPKESTYMVSYLKPELKTLFADLFHACGAYRKVDHRPSVKRILLELERYAQHILLVPTQRRFPESISLQPTSIRPFMHVCEGSCGNKEELVLNDTLFKVNGHFYCKSCAARVQQANGNDRGPAVSTVNQPAPSDSHAAQHRPGMFGWLPNRKGA